MLFGLAVMLLASTWLLQPPMCSIRPIDLPFQAERALVTAYEECRSVAECLWPARKDKVPALKTFGEKGRSYFARSYRGFGSRSGIS